MKIKEESEYRTKCYKCFRPQTECLCEHISTFSTNTKFIFLMHPREFKKERVGTGRLTKLQLENSEIIMGIDFSKNKRVNEIISRYKSLLLYPSKDGTNLTTNSLADLKQSSNAIFIIDSTWSQSKKILKLSTNLQDLPKVHFEPQNPSSFVFKQQPFKECLSTIESTLEILKCLNSGGIENIDKSTLDNFLSPFTKLIEKQIDHQNNPPEGSYRSSKLDYNTNKSNYKKGSLKKVYFDPDRKR